MGTRAHTFDDGLNHRDELWKAMSKTTQVDQNRGDEDGQLAHQATPKAVGHEADNLSPEEEQL